MDYFFEFLNNINFKLDNAPYIQDIIDFVYMNLLQMDFNKEKNSRINKFLEYIEEQRNNIGTDCYVFDVIYCMLNRKSLIDSPNDDNKKPYVFGCEALHTKYVLD